MIPAFFYSGNMVNTLIPARRNLNASSAYERQGTLHDHLLFILSRLDRDFYFNTPIVIGFQMEYNGFVAETATYKINNAPVPNSAKCKCGHTYAAHGSQGMVCCACPRSNPCMIFKLKEE